VTWREAFRQQALSDYDVFRQLKKLPQLPVCHRLHYLQMATEKLAKSFLLVGDGALNKKSHLVLVPFLRLLVNRPDIRPLLTWGDDPRRFTAYMRKWIIPIAEQIQNLAPGGSHDDVMNSEYPWIDGRKGVICPAAYAFTEFTKEDLIRFATFIENLIKVTS
jgi:hypothetical protein